MATERNNQFVVAPKLFMVTIVARLAVLLGARRAAPAASFSFTTIDVSFSDADNLTALGDINSNGQIVGVYDATSGASHAFLDDHGVFHYHRFSRRRRNRPHPAHAWRQDHHWVRY
jgi:probable HAF family extracellular repeat protein